MEKELPKNWVYCTLNDLATIQSGGTPARSNSQYWNGKIPWVKISDIKEFYVEETAETITDEGLKNSSTRIFPKGTILFTIFATIGKVGVLKIDAATNQAIAGITPSKLVDSKFITYSLIELSNEILGLGKGVAQKNINQTILKNTKFPLPPLAEQTRITAKLDALFAQLNTIKASMEKIPVLLKNFRQQLLTQAVTGKLINKREFTTLGELEVQIKTGPFGSALHKSEYIEDGIPVINPSHLKNGNIVPNRLITINKSKASDLKRWILEPNDIILGRRGEMGRSAIYTGSHEKMICGTGSLILKASHKVNPEFLDYYLRSHFCINFLESNAVGSTMINLNQKILKSLPFPKLSYEEQTKSIQQLSKSLKDADTISAQYQTLKEKIDQLPQALLHKAFKGELVPQLESDGDARELLKEIEALKKESNPKTTKRKPKKYKTNAVELGMAAETGDL